MEHTKSRIWISLGVYVIWIAITVFGGQLLLGGELGSLEALVANGVGWHFIAAIAVLLVAIVACRWKDMAFVAPHSLVRTLWFPVLFLCLIATVMLLTGVPPIGVVGFVALNTALVGFSEEVMFRGVIYRALEERMSVWPAIILTSLAFGAVHVANVLITGDLQAAALQAVAATMSGFIFMAIVIRTGSIWPAIVYHALWDFVLFIAGAANEPTADAAQAASEALPGTPWAIALPLALALPNFLCALVLLRGVGKQAQVDP